MIKRSVHFEESENNRARIQITYEILIHFKSKVHKMGASLLSVKFSSQPKKYA
jgi:hypothetical protein